MLDRRQWPRGVFVYVDFSVSSTQERISFLKSNAEDAYSEKVQLYSWANGILEKGFQHHSFSNGFLE